MVTPELAAGTSEGVLSIATALGVGLLVGLERERRKAAGHGSAAGVRTFALVALLGVLAARAGAAAVATAVVFVGAIALLGYARTPGSGMTTEVALVVTLLLGALAHVDVELAAGLGVAVALLLAERTALHRLARETLTERELHDGLLLAAAALIVLPLLPDRGVGPGEALNPVTVWRLAVVIMAVNALGYVAARIAGPRRGLPLAGFAGGFVSSTATIAAMGTRARTAPSLARAAIAGAVASTVATAILTGVVVGIADEAVLAGAAPALALATLVAGGWAAAAARRVGAPADVAPDERGRAFDLKAPVILAATISIVLAAAHLLQEALGREGAILAVAAAGFADSQSAAFSAASLAAAGRLETTDAVLAVLLALTTNSVSKAVAALAFPRGQRLRVLVGLAAVLAAAWAGFAAWRLVR